MQALDYPRCHRPFGAVIKAAGEVTQGAIRCDAIFEEHEMETPNVSRLQWCSVAGSGAIIEAPLEVILDTSEAVESRPDVMGDPLSLHLHMSFPKPLILIESIDPTGVLTLEDRRLFNFLLTASWRSLGRGECGPLSAPTSRLRSRIGQGRERSNRRIERSFQRLAATKILLRRRLPGNQIGEAASALLSHYSVSSRGFAEWDFTPTLRRYLGLPCQCAWLDWEACMSFRSKYSLILYELLSLRRAVDGSIWDASFDELRAQFGIPPGRYRYLSQLCQSVLDPAVAEVSLRTNFLPRVEFPEDHVLRRVSHAQAKVWSDAFIRR